MMTVVFITIAAIAVVMLIMAVGVIVKGRCLRGSCGGPKVVGPDGEVIGCESCGRKQGNQHHAA
ncbi:MAG: hypothetical protein GY953_06595 [bacterium]|nr:hypothetical protein [bacterium]